jgi:hypothetical protein
MYSSEARGGLFGVRRSLPWGTIIPVLVLLCLGLAPRDSKPISKYHGGGRDPVLQALSRILDPVADVGLGGTGEPAPDGRPLLARLEYFVPDDTVLQRTLAPEPGSPDAALLLGVDAALQHPDALDWAEGLVARGEEKALLLSLRPEGFEFEFSPLASERQRLARAWAEAPEGRRVFISFTREDLPSVERMNPILEEAGFTTFRYLADATKAPWATPAEFVSYFGSADHHFVVDSTHARKSVGVAEEALWHRELSRRREVVEGKGREAVVDPGEASPPHVVTKANFERFLESMRGREPFEVVLGEKTALLRVNELGEVKVLSGEQHVLALDAERTSRVPGDRLPREVALVETIREREGSVLDFVATKSSRRQSVEGSRVLTPFETPRPSMEELSTSKAHVETFQRVLGGGGIAIERIPVEQRDLRDHSTVEGRERALHELHKRRLREAMEPRVREVRSVR